MTRFPLALSIRKHQLYHGVKVTDIAFRSKYDAYQVAHNRLRCYTSSIRDVVVPTLVYVVLYVFASFLLFSIYLWFCECSLVPEETLQDQDDEVIGEDVVLHRCINRIWDHGVACGYLCNNWASIASFVRDSGPSRISITLDTSD